MKKQIKKEEIFDYFVDFLSEKYNISSDEFTQFLKKQQKKKQRELTVPVSLFKHQKLSSLELLVKYLHENKKLRFVDIAKLLARDPRAIAATYYQSQHKFSGKLSLKSSPYKIPVSLFSNRQLSVLEHLASYLADFYGLRLCAIADLLGKDQRTIWTVVQRAKEKMSKKKSRARGGSIV